jgi:hypothetical protein
MSIPGKDAPADEATEWIIKVLRRRAAGRHSFREFSLFSARSTEEEKGDESGSGQPEQYEHDLFLLGSDVWSLTEDELYRALPPALPNRLARLVAKDVVTLRRDVSSRCPYFSRRPLSPFLACCGYSC